MNYRQIRKDIEETERHNQITCRSGDPEYDRAQSGRSNNYDPYDPDKIHDYDGPPPIDEEYERLHLRGTDRCHCGGYAMLTVEKEGPGDGRIYSDSPDVQHAWCASCGHSVTLPESAPTTDLIAEWNKGVARRKFLRAAIDAERKETRRLRSDFLVGE